MLILRVSRQVTYQSAIEKAVKTAEPLTSSLSMQYVIEPDAMPDRCNPSVVLNAAMYKRPGTISTACTAQHTTVKACRRESSTLEGRVGRCACLRKLVRRAPIVSEWALQMLHGCSNPLGGRAAPTSCRRCPRLPRFLFSRCVHQCFKMPGFVCSVTRICCADVTGASSNSARSGVTGSRVNAKASCCDDVSESRAVKKCYAVQ